MKKIILILLLFLISYCTAGEYTHQETIEKIKQETQACLDNSDGNPDMIKCEEAGIKRYNSEIEQILIKLSKELTKAQYQKLADSQNEWKKYIIKDNILLENTFEKVQALDCQLHSVSIKYNNTKQRAEELNTILELYPLYKEDIIPKK